MRLLGRAWEGSSSESWACSPGFSAGKICNSARWPNVYTRGGGEGREEKIEKQRDLSWLYQRHLSLKEIIFRACPEAAVSCNWN